MIQNILKIITLQLNNLQCYKYIYIYIYIKQNKTIKKYKNIKIASFLLN